MVEVLPHLTGWSHRTVETARSLTHGAAPVRALRSRCPSVPEELLLMGLAASEGPVLRQCPQEQEDWVTKPWCPGRVTEPVEAAQALGPCLGSGQPASPRIVAEQGKGRDHSVALEASDLKASKCLSAQARWPKQARGQA